jgi:hypothetical protein
MGIFKISIRNTISQTECRVTAAVYPALHGTIVLFGGDVRGTQPKEMKKA